MVFTKVQLWISFVICAVVLANGSNFQMYKNLDSEQEHELLDLDADIDPDTGVRRYDNYQLFRVTPSTDEHIDILQFLNKGLVQIWSPLSPNVSLVDHADLMVAPKHAGHVKSYLSCSGMGVQVVSDNLQRQIDLENVVEDLPPTRSKGGCLDIAKLNFRNYHGVKTFHNYLDCLSQVYSDMVSLQEIGRSTEGRSLKVIKIGKPATDGRVKPAVWIDAGIHAREWISPATALYFINQLVEHPEDPQNRFVVEQLDLYILPSANPDGYEYSRKWDRMWRKTRSNTGSSCIGVDPNRNWGHEWGGKGASNNPCTETYRGKRPFSEPETKAIASFILKKMKSQQIKMYLTIHSYGQYFLYPWGYEKLDTHDRHELHNMGRIGAEAIKRVNPRRKYKVGSAAKMLYPASGGSDDWAKGGAGIKYSYTVELPDTGSYGFLLPSSRIESVGKETHAGFLAMFRKLILDKTG